jgi:hypothetical protein
MRQRTQDIRSRIVLMLLNEVNRGWRTLLSILVSLFAILGRTVRLVQDPGTDTCWIRLAVNSTVHKEADVDLQESSSKLVNKSLISPSLTSLISAMRYATSPLESDICFSMLWWRRIPLTCLNTPGTFLWM